MYGSIRLSGPSRTAQGGCNMSRVAIDLPELFPFSTELAVRVSDLNYGNHLGNDSVLTLIHEARRRFLQSLGLEEIGADGLGFVIADAAVTYRAQAFYGDHLRVEVAAGDFGSRGCDFYYRITHAAAGHVVAEAKTGVVYFDFHAQKTVSLPAKVLAKLRGSPD
jgi:acyl-CoA thioester hydrolase